MTARASAEGERGLPLGGARVFFDLPRGSLPRCHLRHQWSPQRQASSPSEQVKSETLSRHPIHNHKLQPPTPQEKRARDRAAAGREQLTVQVLLRLRAADCEGSPPHTKQYPSSHPTSTKKRRPHPYQDEGACLSFECQLGGTSNVDGLL
eukprot:9163904-Pyramimonas_sp.AAC.1